MAEMVKSVEYIEITSITTTASGLLSKGQDTDNCVPFATGHRDGADNMRQGFADVYFGVDGITGSGTINVEFAYVDASTKVDRIFIVEFDSAEVKVQQGTFSMVSTTTDTPTISGIDMGHTAMVHYYNSNSVTDSWDYHSVRGYFSSSTQAEFRRDTGIGTISGHYYIFEALNNQFSVQSKLFSAISTMLVHQEIDWVPWHKSFVLCSYYTHNASSYPYRGTCRVFLQSPTRLMIDRFSSSGNIYAHCFVVTFNDNKKHVQRGFCAFATTDTILNYDLESAVDLDYSMVTTAKVSSIIKTNSSTLAAVEASFVSTEFITSSGIKIERNSTGSTAGEAQWEIVEWCGKTMVSGSNLFPLNPDLSCVKSVESFNLDIDRWYKDYELTKGQDVTNCVPFISTRGDGVADYQGALMTNVWFSEPGLISAQRTSEIGTTKVYVNVVEFYPDQVRVQQGNACIANGAYEGLVTVSGVAQGKSALLFNSNTYTSVMSTIFDYHAIRGKFNNNTQLQFYRNTVAATTITDINYYIFEDLVGNFEVEAVQESMISVTNCYVITDLHLKYNNTFFLYSYYTHNASSYLYRGTCRARLLNTQGVSIDRYNTSGNVYLSVFVIKFLDRRRHVDHYNSSLSSSTPDTANINSVFLGNDASFMVFCPNCNTAGTVNTSAITAIPEMCASVEITTSGTVLKSQREGGTVVGQYSFVFIDWVGYKPVAQQRIDTNSFVRSVTHKEVSMESTLVEEVYILDGQILENCIPFVTQKGTGTLGNQYNLMPMVIIYSDGSNQVSIHRGNDTGTLDVSIYIVEFDPEQVKVQRGSFFIDETFVTKTIESVDLDKAFVIGSYCCDGSTVGWNQHLVQTKFNSATEVSITRNNNTGNIYGYYYVVEALGDQFKVKSIDFPAGTASTDVYGEFTAFRPNLHRTMFVGSYTHVDGSGYPQRASYRMFTRVDDLIQMNKYSATTSYDTIHVFVVEFNKTLGVKTYTGFSDLITGVASTTYSFLSSNEFFDIDRSMVCNLLTNNISRGDGSSTPIHKENLFHKMELTNSGTEVTVDRYSTETNTYSFWQVVGFPPFKTHYFEGVVEEEGVPVAGRYVRTYRTDTGELLEETTSASGTGYFFVGTSHTGEHMMVCLDDDAPLDYNYQIHSKLYPEVL